MTVKYIIHSVRLDTINIKEAKGRHEIIVLFGTFFNKRTSKYTENGVVSGIDGRQSASECNTICGELNRIK